jgi:2,4-dienoyl-CoA reductase-like NADH-dependent reductase (Old Yellow Enzyme family)/thioredoxin reductase
MLQKKVVKSMFPKLFEPGYMGKLWLKNRLVKAPTLTCLGTMDGCVTERTIQHYKELALGGAGLIIVEYTYVDDDASKSAQCQLGISNDEHRPGMEWLAATMKANGAATCLQIEHCGRQRFLGKPPIKTVTRFPWEELYAMGTPPPEELTFEEIVELVKRFGDAALRAKQVGFDMVEIHGAHGYLITNFLSPRLNKRTDWYGGSLTNRMRFLLEVVADIRSKIGQDYPLGVRLSGTDYEEEDPITIDETKEVAKALEKAGVDVIHVSGGIHHIIDLEHAPMYWPPGNNIWCAEEIKKVVNIPVIASGSITTPELAEQVLKEEKADFVSFGRPLLADPYFPLKAQEGHPEDIRPCIRCLECVAERGISTGSINCAVNVAVGKEAEFKITLSANPKKVAVIGGGPAGMEAAIVAALKGHEVTLFEKRQLGGMLIEASVPEFKADLRSLIDYLATQVKKTGVKVVNSKATSHTIKDGKFDVVIVATGATPWTPNVPGLDKPSVMGILDVLGGAKTGKNVIVVGGGLGGCDAALFLAEQGKKVTIVEVLDKIGAYMNQGESAAFFKRLSKQDVEIRTSMLLAEVTDSGVIVQDKFGIKSEVKGDTVVLATGFAPNRKLFEELSQVPDLEVYAVGDCVEARKIYDAIHEGHWAVHLL